MKGKRVNINTYVTILEPYLKLGLTLHEACKQSRIPYTTVIKYKKDHEDVCRRLDALEDYAVVIAKISLMKGIKEDPNLALKYLERVRRNEFSLKTEQVSKYQVQVRPIMDLTEAQKAILSDNSNNIPPILGGASAGHAQIEQNVEVESSLQLEGGKTVEYKPDEFEEPRKLQDNPVFKDYNNILISPTKLDDNTID